MLSIVVQGLGASFTNVAGKTIFAFSSAVLI